MGATLTGQSRKDDTAHFHNAQKDRVRRRVYSAMEAWTGESASPVLGLGRRKMDRSCQFQTLLQSARVAETSQTLPCCCVVFLSSHYEWPCKKLERQGKPLTKSQNSYEAGSQAISAECMSRCAFRGIIMHLFSRANGNLFLKDPTTDHERPQTGK